MCLFLQFVSNICSMGGLEFKRKSPRIFSTCEKIFAREIFTAIVALYFLFIFYFIYYYYFKKNFLLFIYIYIYIYIYKLSSE